MILIDEEWDFAMKHAPYPTRQEFQEVAAMLVDMAKYLKDVTTFQISSLSVLNQGGKTESSLRQKVASLQKIEQRCSQLSKSTQTSI